MSVASSPTVPASATRGRIPGFPVLIGAVFAVCVVGMTCSILAEIAFGYVGSGDQPRSLQEQLAGVVGFGTAALVISLVVARFAGSTPERARVGAVVMGVLAVPALFFFWCGMPGMFGATAAHLAGLTRGGVPASGAPRLFGLVGLALAILNTLANFLAVSISWIVGAF